MAYGLDEDGHSDAQETISETPACGGAEVEERGSDQESSPLPAVHTGLTPTHVSLSEALSSVSDEGTPQLEAFFVRLFSNEVPASVRAKTKADTYAALDHHGPDYFLEEIARGSIPVEIAFRYELPLIYFMRWLRETADPEDYDFAMGLCADTLAAKSRVVLESTPANAAEGSMIREYAKRALDLAERIAPDGWSSSKKPKGADGPTGNTLQIAIMMPNGPDGKPQMIPGLELLSGVTAGVSPESAL